MYIRKIGICAVAVFVLSLVGGCNKSDSNETTVRASAPNQPLATVHWVGMKRVAADPNAAGFLKIWRLPETERLTAQTLEKLALAPWSFAGTNRPPVTTNYPALIHANPSAVLLRPLLDDLVQTECYVEVRGGQNDKPSCLVVALKLQPDRAQLWENNLGTILEKSTGAHRAPNKSAAAGSRWQVQAPNPASVSPILRHVDFARFGEWTLVGLAAESNPVFSESVSRIQEGQVPFVASGSAGWLQTVLDLRSLSAVFAWGWNLPQDWPRISLSLNGDSKNLLTQGRLTFPKPLPQVEPWNIPTNLIHEPIHSFTAVQSIKPWLDSIAWWQKLHAPSTPNQLFSWGQVGSPFLDYAAAPLPGAHNTMTKLGPAIMESLNPTLAANQMGKWEPAANSDGVAWSRAPAVTPIVQSVRLPTGDFLFAGLSPLLVTNSPPPVGTLRDMLSQSNLVYFDREVTGPRVEALLYVTQLFRMIFRHAQLPREGAATKWLKAAEPLLGVSSTSLVKTGSSELTLTRSSTFGVTAAECHLVADWLESPQFPVSAYTVVSKLPPLGSIPPRR